MTSEEVRTGGPGLSTDPPAGADAREWVALTDEPIPLDRLWSWVTRPSCGAVVTFTGTVRDHAPGRPGVTSLEYEVHPDQALVRLTEVAAAARRRWPELGRVAVVHRVGRLIVGEASVGVAVSAPHRTEAFDAARFCIDTVKRTVPVWKLEHWADGAGWSVCDHEVEDVEG